ncbi:MAG: DUF2339 domain-containing protein [Acidobacteriota bacterium]|nr:MAG: DUF2339 domain-containing protein [Acidobacteriota bacterium]
MELFVFFLVLVVFGAPILGLVIVIALFTRMKRVEQRLVHLDRAQQRAPAAAGAAETRAAPERAAADRPPPAARPLEPARPAAAPSGPAPATPPPSPPTSPPPEPERVGPRLHEIPPSAPPAEAGGASIGRELPPEPPASHGLEEKLAARLFVWIGAIALALAGIFLVKYSFDRGLLGPTTRVLLGLLFGVVLLVVGEFLRRRVALIATGLTAAGIAVLYASLLAGVSLYGLIPRTPGFLLIVLVTAVAVALSLRQGPMIALVGLLGGFISPALIGSEEPQPAALFSYLFLLQLGLLLVVRRRGWWLLAPLTMLGGIAWAGAWIGVMFESSHAVWLGMFLFFSAALSVLAERASAASEPFAASGPLGAAQRLAISPAVGSAALGVGAGLLLAAVMTWQGRFNTTEWIFFGLLGAGALVLGRIDARYEPFAWMAPAAGAVLLWLWGGGGFSATLGLATTEPLGGAEATRFAWTLLLLAVLFAGGVYALMFQSARPARWASLSVMTAVGYLLVAYRFIEQPAWLPWGAIALLLAGVYTLGAIPLGRRRDTLPGGEAALAAAAVGATAFVALAVPMELERAWISVAWALEVAALAWLHRALRVRALLAVAGILAAAVSVRLLLNPAVLEYPIGEHALLNWLTYGYGLPILAFVFAARWLRDDDKTAPLPLALEGASVAFGFALLGLLVRHYVHPDKMFNADFTLREVAGYSVFWLAYAAGLLIAQRRWPSPLLAWSAWAL